jgi:hypothetical protein
MRIARVLTVLTLVMFWAAPAHAARSWWGWLEELSGPGPFMGTMYSSPVVCWGKGMDHVPCDNFTKPKPPKEVKERNATVKKSLQLTFGVLSSGHNPRLDKLVGVAGQEEENRRRVFAVPVNAAFMLRPHRSLDFGPGLGFIYFKGDGTPATTRFVGVANASWKFLLYGATPSAAWRRVLSLEYQGTYVTKGFTGSDFGGPAALLHAPHEYRHSFGVAFDLGEWLKAQ